MAPVLTNFKDKNLVRLLDTGGVGVIPTDTLYGIVCSATNTTAVGRLYELKNRDKKPGTIIASCVDQLVSLGIKKRYLIAVSDYWPGPISIIIPTNNPDLKYLDMGKGTLAVRVVASVELVDLLKETGPLLTSSANMPEKDPANNIEEAKNYFGNSIDFYVDGGDFSGRQPSTLIRVIDDAVEVLRNGAVTIGYDKQKGE